MDVKKGYGMWAGSYDSSGNKTRDLEKMALETCLKDYRFDAGIETGCGTGKNTVWLASKCDELTAVDLTEEMLAVARGKISLPNVRFVQADITRDWSFTQGEYNLITFNLVLEHVEFLEPVFRNAAMHLKSGGILYVGELHPFKQYAGTKARFETEDGVLTLPCYTHNISDFTHAGINAGLDILDINEFFDGNDRKTIPRILMLLFRKG